MPNFFLAAVACLRNPNLLSGPSGALSGLSRKSSSLALKFKSSIDLAKAFFLRSAGILSNSPLISGDIPKILFPMPPFSSASKAASGLLRLPPLFLDDLIWLINLSLIPFLPPAIFEDINSDKLFTCFGVKPSSSTISGANVVVPP